MLEFTLKDIFSVGALCLTANLAFSLFSASETIAADSNELTYVIDSHSLLSDIAEKRIDQECAESPAMNEEHELPMGDIYKIGSNAYLRCPLEAYTIASSTLQLMGETTFTPIKASIPIATFKAALSDSDAKPERCSDQVNKLILACPEVAERYIKRITIPEATS